MNIDSTVKVKFNIWEVGTWPWSFTMKDDDNKPSNLCEHSMFYSAWKQNNSWNFSGLPCTSSTSSFQQTSWSKTRREGVTPGMSLKGSKTGNTCGCCWDVFVRLGLCKWKNIYRKLHTEHIRAQRWKAADRRSYVWQHFYHPNFLINIHSDTKFLFILCCNVLLVGKCENKSLGGQQLIYDPQNYIFTESVSCRISWKRSIATYPRVLRVWGNRVEFDHMIHFVHFLKKKIPSHLWVLSVSRVLVLSTGRQRCIFHSGIATRTSSAS